MRTEKPRFIASERILWLRSDGTETYIVANVGEPYQLDPERWACPASLDGVDGRYPDIHGSSSLQSLCLAIRLVSTRLGQMLDDKETLLYPSDRTCAWDLQSFDAVFGKRDPGG